MNDKEDKSKNKSDYGINELKQYLEKYIKALKSKLIRMDYEIEAKKTELIKILKEQKSLKKNLSKVKIHPLKKDLIIDTKTENINNCTKLWSIDYIGKGNKKCKKCQEELYLDIVWLGLFKNKYEQSTSAFIECPVLYCTKCKLYYINNIFKKEIQKKIGKNVIKIGTPKENEIKPNDNVNIERKLYKEDGNKDNLTKDNAYFDSLNKKSELYKLGYNVSKLNKEERKQILLYKAIPELGIDNILSLLNYLVELRKNNKRYVKAVAAWKCDIELLEKHKRGEEVNGS
ncbi:hypothetical protein [Clostridium sp. BSD9I1]|uniref:hypothetical protein n=1 Tax=Clostridium sp. BSD9I1 TaxID=2003589 RepID=UPI0016493354|nr:hypothetical protein [Clostridium sp. BSD9I1]